MKEIQNYDQVVVNLDSEGGISVNTPTTTFEEAFMGEDFSEAQGKRRAKRQTRKLQKTADKRERKTAKRGKKSDRQTERIARRATRKSLRQDIRDEQAASRRARRALAPRKQREEQIYKDDVNPQEEYVDETMKEGYQDDFYDENYYPSDEDQQDDQYYPGSESEDGSYDEDGGYYEEESDEDTYYGDESEEGDAEGMDDEIIYDDENNFTGEMTGKKPIPKEISDCCMRIEWNDELIARLKDAKQKNSLSDVSTTRIQDVIDEKQSRMNELKSSLADYAAGSPEQADIAKRARLAARQERMKICPYPIRKRLRDRGMSDQEINQWWTKSGQQKIEQKMSNAAGVSTISSNQESTNIAQFDDPVYDYDQPKTQVVNVENGEIKSNLTGENKDFWKSLLIGGLVGFAAIYAINKYKLLK
jgi:hypothetical protein